MEKLSGRRAKTRVVVAFLFLFGFGIALSAGVYYLGTLQENMAARESRTALQAITDHKQIDDALRLHPSNQFLKLIAMAATAERETSAAAEKLSAELEPPALSKGINLAAASRTDLEAIRRDLKTAETNATIFLPRYMALIKAERDKLENYARSLHVEKAAAGRFLDEIDKRQAETAALFSNNLVASAEFYQAYQKCVAVLLAEFGIYKVTNGQFIFPLQHTANRYNVAANAMNAAARHLAELEEQRKALMQSHLEGWEKFVGGE